MLGRTNLRLHRGVMDAGDKIADCFATARLNPIAKKTVSCYITVIVIYLCPGPSFGHSVDTLNSGEKCHLS